MKPFDPTKPVQTRDGRKARIICTDRKIDEGYDERPIVALVTANNRYETPYFYYPDGRSNSSESLDLVNISEETVEYRGWDENGQFIEIGGTPFNDLSGPIHMWDGVLKVIRLDGKIVRIESVER